MPEGAHSDIKRPSLDISISAASCSPSSADVDNVYPLAAESGDASHVNPPEATVEEAKVPRVVKNVRTSTEHRPPLPPWPSNLSLLREAKPKPADSAQNGSSTLGPNLQSTATTAVSRTDIQTHGYQDGSRNTFEGTADSTPTRKPYSTLGSVRRIKNISGGDTGDAASVRSLAPTLGRGADNESLLGDVLGTAQDLPTWKLFGGEDKILDSPDIYQYEEQEIDADFHREFDALIRPDEERQDEGSRIVLNESL